MLDFFPPFIYYSFGASWLNEAICPAGSGGGQRSHGRCVNKQASCCGFMQDLKLLFCTSILWSAQPVIQEKADQIFFRSDEAQHLIGVPIVHLFLVAACTTVGNLWARSRTTCEESFPYRSFTCFEPFFRRPLRSVRGKLQS